jgi:hypothetical protein
MRGKESKWISLEKKEERRKRGEKIRPNGMKDEKVRGTRSKE